LSISEKRKNFTIFLHFKLLKTNKQLSGIPFAVEKLERDHLRVEIILAPSLLFSKIRLHKTIKIRVARSSALQKEIKKTYLLPQSREPVALG
jgi:hypothetical protein